MTTFQQDIAEVAANHAQRICVPNKWRVWREGDKVMHEILDTAKNVFILAGMC